LPGQRLRHREFIPIGLLSIIRILARRNGHVIGLITFRSQENKR
jgi:hypothetical protein